MILVAFSRLSEFVRQVQISLLAVQCRLVLYCLIQLAQTIIILSALHLKWSKLEFRAEEVDIAIKVFFQLLCFCWLKTPVGLQLVLTEQSCLLKAFSIDASLFVDLHSVLSHILGNHFHLLEVVFYQLLPLFVGIANVRKTTLKNGPGLAQLLLS